MLQQQPSPRGQGGGRIRGDQPKGIEPIGSAAERQPGFVLPHHRIQPTPDFIGDVRGIGDHQVQLPPVRPQGLPPAALEQLYLFQHSQPLQVLPCHGKGFRGDVHREAPAAGPEACQGSGQAAGSCAQIGPEARFPGGIFALGLRLAGDLHLGQLHQQFRFLARNENARAHGQFEVAPRAAPHQVLQRFTGVKTPLPQACHFLQRGSQLHRLIRAEQQPLQGVPAQPTAKIEQPVELVATATQTQLLAPPSQQSMPAE